MTRPRSGGAMSGEGGAVFGLGSRQVYSEGMRVGFPRRGDLR